MILIEISELGSNWARLLLAEYRGHWSLALQTGPRKSRETHSASKRDAKREQVAPRYLVYTGKCPSAWRSTQKCSLELGCSGVFATRLLLSTETPEGAQGTS